MYEKEVIIDVDQIRWSLGTESVHRFYFWLILVSIMIVGSTPSNHVTRSAKETQNLLSVHKRSFRPKSWHKNLLTSAEVIVSRKFWFLCDLRAYTHARKDRISTRKKNIEERENEIDES